MCYNCGCGLPNDDMGQGNAGLDQNGKSITTKTFEEAAKSQGMTTQQAMEETFKLLKKELKK
ncbi:MAG TPA: hypothetical protein VF820_04625 [Patescibacteria group bacterium]